MAVYTNWLHMQVNQAQGLPHITRWGKRATDLAIIVSKTAETNMH